MAKHATDQPLTITPRWVRPAVATGKGETHLVVTIKTVKPAKRTRRPAVDVAFVIDRSGSMSGHPFNLARKGVIAALDLLNDADGMAVVAYDDEITTISPLIPATPANRKQVTNALRGLETRGSTNLFGGWLCGCEHLAHPEFGVAGRVRRTILLTDGLANVGLVDHAQISRQVTMQRMSGVSTSTLGLGTGIDEALLSGMAEAGGGNFAFAELPKDLPAFFARELGEALSVVASETVLTLVLPKGVRAHLLNPFPVERSGKQLSIALGDLPAGMSLDLVFAITSRAKAVGPFPALELAGEWRSVESGSARERVQAPVDTLMAVDPSDFESMPRDKKAAQVVAQMVADDARRTALRHYRSGDLRAAQMSLSGARFMAMSAPASADIVSEIDEMMAFDPASPDFQLRSRQIENDAHRRSRGRNV